MTPTRRAAGRVRDPRDAAAIDSLLGSHEPSIRTLARTELLDEKPTVALRRAPRLRLLARAGRVRDERAGAALDLLEECRRPDGRWRAGGSWWKPPGQSGSNAEAFDWGRHGPTR